MARSRFLLGACSIAALIIGGTVASASETQTYVYDELGRLVSVSYAGTINNGQKHSTCFDPSGNRTGYKSDSGGAGLTCTPTPSPTPTPTPTPAPTIVISDASGTEGTTLTFTVTLSTASGGTITVAYATATGTAAANDFTSGSGTLNFSPGQTSKTIGVFANTDSRAETNEYFYVNLTSPTGGTTIADSQGRGTIIDDGSAGCPTCR